MSVDLKHLPALEHGAREKETADETRLHELGYKQEFKREFTTLSTIAFAFSIMGVISSVSSTLSFGLAGGGHVGMVWGWFVPGAFVICIALSMAELASAMPTSGGPSSRRRTSSLMTGYANVTGQMALVASIDYTCAEMITSAITVASDFNTTFTLPQTFGVFLGIVAIHSVICSSATKVLARLNIAYVVVNLATTFATIICFAVVPSEHVSTTVAFTEFENFSTWSSSASFLLAFTAPMWTLTGYDSAAHVAEEVINAAVVAPLAIVSAVSATWVLGLALLISASYTILDVGGLLGSSLSLPMAQLYYNVLGKQGMLAIWSCVIIVQFVCGAAQLVDASRVVFAFSRDDALPGSKYLKRIHSYTSTPVNAVVFVALGAGLMGLLTLNLQAGLALFDVSVIALYISYVLPIFIRITSGRSRFVPGPFSLGRFSVVIGSIAVAWVAFILVVLLFPSNAAPDSSGMNYAVVILGAILGGAALWFFVSARHWFTGPIRNFIETDVFESDASSTESPKEKYPEEKTSSSGAAKVETIEVM